MKVQLGHDGPPVMYRENLITGEPLARCPLRAMQLADPAVIDEAERMRLEYYPLYTAGHLLVEGGVADQPALYLAYMREIDDLAKLTDLKAKQLDQPDGGEGM